MKKYPYNSPEYRVPYGRFISEWFDRTSRELMNPGEELPIMDVDQYHANRLALDGYICLSRRDRYFGVVGLNVPMKIVEQFEKCIVPKFKIGDVVVKEVRGVASAPFRIWGYNWRSVAVWYYDGWCEATGLASGVLEPDLRLATSEELGAWEIEYNDNLVKEAKPELYNSVMNRNELLG